MRTAPRTCTYRTAIVVTVLVVHFSGQETLSQNAPVVDSGLPRYAASDPVRLDGTASYDPDASGPLTYAWKQVSGPLVTVVDENTARPTVSGFVQTTEVQECVFELTVTDAEMEIASGQAHVLIVPDFGAESVELYNDAFDPAKPTMIYFGGGDCTIGSLDYEYGARLSLAQLSGWLGQTNILWFPNGYSPDSGPGRTYYRYADMLIVYLSRLAPDYTQPIQTLGWSTGGQPAIDVAIRLNQTYADPRYAVNHVTFLDATVYCRDYTESVARYLAAPVAGEPCWVENHVASLAENYILGPSPSFPLFHNSVLNVEFEGYTSTGMAWLSQHLLGNDWLWQSLRDPEAMTFNGGVAAGAYWSVVGPGKNLQLASTPGQRVYQFRWRDHHLEMADEARFPGRLPEPVRLAAWSPDAAGSESSGGAILSCYASANAVGYELLLGSHPHHISGYRLVSDTPAPPMDIVADFSPEDRFWTIRVRDRHGSTIYADPLPLELSDLPPLTVKNTRTQRRYGLIQQAILDAEPGDTVLLEPAVYEENVEVTTPLTLCSSIPDDPLIVAETILRGRHTGPVVTFSGSGSSPSVLAGLTIQSATIGISCRNAMPAIRHCVVEAVEGIAVEYWYGRPPVFSDCTFLGRVAETPEPGLIAYWSFDEVADSTADDPVGGNDGLLTGDAVWMPDAGRFAGALQFDGLDDCVVVGSTVLNPAEGAVAVFAWVRGGAPGQVIISQQTGADWLMADPSAGRLMTTLRKPRGRVEAPPLVSDVTVTDGQWHHVALVWTGQDRVLYVDGVEVARDAHATPAGSTGGLHIGCGADAAPGTFWLGLIDDVRIYNVALSSDEVATLYTDALTN
ncbi:MAG: hypothetical protein JW993_09320 [Sedimentisphaerales bacterium]|nr:hypothetical protein [Sedimentisphaerales bacterium]